MWVNSPVKARQALAFTVPKIPSVEDAVVNSLPYV